jgi:hypothetical protein
VQRELTCQRRFKSRPRGGAKLGQWRAFCAMAGALTT